MDKNKFQEFKRAYPQRDGPQPWAAAERVFQAAVKDGEDPDRIIAAIRAGIGYDRRRIGSQYIPQAVKWLTDRRYREFAPHIPRQSCR